jgi:beta-lactamase regulating signal transducer with metallopeptidase domain
MIEQMPELCLQLLYYIFLASWRALPVFVAVATATLALRNRVPARYLCWLWLIVVARLLLPVSATSMMAISSVVDVPVQALLSEVANDYDRVEVGTLTLEGPDGTQVTVAHFPDGATAEQQTEADAYVTRINAQELPSHSADASTQPIDQIDTSDYPLVTVESVTNLLVFILFLGLPAFGILLLIRGIVSHLRFAWMLRVLPPVYDRDAIDCLLRVCDEVGVGLRPRLKVVPSLDAPAMFGLVWPTVCLPVGWREKLTMLQLEWVLRHEVAHVRGS